MLNSTQEDYLASRHIALEAMKHDCNAFYACMFAAIREADSFALSAIESAFPELVAEFRQRRNAPDGLIPSDLTPRVIIIDDFEDEDEPDTT